MTNLAVDNFEKHIEDTMIAGDWISDRAAVEKVVRNAPAQIQELIKWGVHFDKKEDGTFDLHREGGHSEFRIARAATRSSASCTIRTTRARRYRPASSKPSNSTPTSRYSPTTMPWKSSRSTTWASS